MLHLFSRFAPVLLLLAAALAAGCAASAPQRTYSVSVDNRLSQPITVFLTKNGPPLEDQWLTPGQWAAGPINRDELIANFAVIKPGETVGIKKAVGHFEANTDAILQVYEQTGRIEDLAAIGLDDPRRTDVVLMPGANAFVVTTDEKGILVTPTSFDAADAATQP